MMTKSTVAIGPMAITSPSENRGNSNSDFMKQNTNINIDDSPTNDKPEWRYNQEPPDNISPSTTASSHNLYYPACAKSVGPKGLGAESARAVTGRRCPHSGKGEDFLTGQLNFFTETAVTPERKVEKSFPRWEINRHGEG